MKNLILATLFVFHSGAWAQFIEQSNGNSGNGSSSNQISYEVLIHEDIKRISHDTADSILTAIKFVSMNAPEGVELVPAQGNKADVIIEITDGWLMLQNEKEERGGFRTGGKTEQHSMFLNENPNGSILTRINFTKVSRGLNPQGRYDDLPDTLVRLVTAISREVYGSVRYLQMNKKHLMSETFKKLPSLQSDALLDSQIFALKENIAFIKRAIDATNENIPSKLTKDFKAALARGNEELQELQEKKSWGATQSVLGVMCKSLLNGKPSKE